MSIAWNKLKSAFSPLNGQSRLWPAVVVATALSLAILSLPVGAPDLGADASWCGVLEWAHQHRMQFGKDIVFTYGPLGFLFTPYTLQAPRASVAWANTLLCFQSMLGLCLVAWRLGWGWRALLLGIFVWESGPMEFRADLAVEIGLLSWGLLFVVELGKRQKLCALAFIVVAGVASLVKLSHLVAAGLSVCACAAYAASRGKYRLGVSILGGFGGVFLIGWVACGQALSNLGSFLVKGFLVSRDYDQGVGLAGLPMLRTAGFVLGGLALAAVWLRTLGARGSAERQPWTGRAILLVWFSGLLWLVWKHSLVRVDRYHVIELAVFAPVIALALEVVTASGPKQLWAARLATLGCCLVSWALMEYAFLPELKASVIQPFRLIAYHSRCLIFPSSWRQDLQPGIEANRSLADLPELRARIGTASADVFGSRQAYALLDGLAYRPRPVFQSYAVYNPALARLNEEFYLSERGPEFVLFETPGLDHRFGVLSDGLAFRALLLNYRATASEGPFLLLQRQSSEPATLKLLREGSVRAGEPIPLAEGGTGNIWLELELEPTALGRLGSWLTRPATIRLSAWDQTAAGMKLLARGGAAPPLLRTGFVASPCLLKLEDVRRFYKGEPALRPSAYSVELNDAPRCWRPGIRFRVYQIENRPLK